MSCSLNHEVNKRAYSRIFIDNIGNQGKEKIVFLYYNTSKTYTNRSRFLGTVNACDPIISNGLSESILKKQTNKCCYLKERR